MECSIWIYQKFLVSLHFATKVFEDMEEIWKEIPGYEGLYQVSSLGRFKALSRVRKGIYGNRIYKERLL